METHPIREEAVVKPINTLRTEFSTLGVYCKYFSSRYDSRVVNYEC